MSIIWWALYILGAITVVILWINIMTLVVRVFTYIFKSEWCKVKVIQGPPGPKGEPGERGPRGYDGEQGVLTRKDIESLIRMEVAAHLSKLEISRTSYPGLGKEEIKIQMKEDK